MASVFAKSFDREGIPEPIRAENTSRRTDMV